MSIEKFLKPLSQFEPCEECGEACFGKCRKPIHPDADNYPQ